MQQLEADLLLSIQHYEGLLQFLQKMDLDIGTADPAALQNLNRALQELQEQAVQLDQKIAPQLDAKSLKNATIQKLTKKRELLLKELLLLNQRITAKASGVKSLIAHEIGKLRTGLSAMSGYRQPQHNQGRITNCTS
ncbi:MAG: hypothetical protein JZU65_16295 [Chlorobium sp.]|nr:hypothetical protein [Chlorobium sp.]